MAANLRISPEELRAAAIYLLQCGDRICEHAAQMRAKLEEVGAGWEVVAHSAFAETFNSSMLPVLTKDLPEVTEGLAAQMRAAAESLETVEKEIIQALKSK